jgi:hypothetical protein
MTSLSEVPAASVAVGDGHDREVSVLRIFMAPRALKEATRCMWSRLDDGLLDHPKVSTAAREVGGRNARAIVIGFYAMALMWTNRHLTDGILSEAIVQSFSSYVVRPQALADALMHAGLFDKHEGGYRIHDFRDYNLSAVDVKRKRQQNRDRMRSARAWNGRA